MIDKKIELIKEIYDIKDDDLNERKEVLKEIEKFADEVMDKFYEVLLSKSDFAVFIPMDKIDAMKKVQIAFVSSLFSEPFDEKLYNKIAKVGITHYHIKLDPLHLSYGYHLLSTLILEQLKKNPALLPHLKIVIKYLKVAEAIMDEEYFEQKNIENSPYKANDLSAAIREVNSAYLQCSKNIDAIINGKLNSIKEKKKERFEEKLDAASKYRDILLDIGLDISLIKRYCTMISNAKDDEQRAKTAKSLKEHIKSSLNDLETTSFLSLDSSLHVVKNITDIVYKKAAITKKHDLSAEQIRNNIFTIILDSFGWAVESLKFEKEEKKDKDYDVVKHFYIDEDIYYLCVKVKTVSNKIYITEALDLLCEIIKLTFFILRVDDA